MKRWMMVVGTGLILAGCAGGPRGARGNQPYTPSAPTIIATPAALFIATADADRDTIVTRAELAAETARAFASGDEDGDGMISIIAISGVLERWIGSRDSVPSGASLDRDGDGDISRAEFDGEFLRQFDWFDEDNDGRLSRTELISVTRGGVPRPPEGVRPPRPGEGPAGGQPPGR